jgi:Icc-related predicted phosphoesterase
MRVVITSDLHGSLPEIPECDLLLISGDVCPVWNHDLKYQESWLRAEFYDWQRQQPAKKQVVIPGNHDFVLERKPGLTGHLFGTWLIDQTGVIPDLDVKIHGSPWSNKFGNWAYMATEDQLREKWLKIPKDIDILMVHGPAHGYGDQVNGFSMVKRGMWEKEHVGSTSLYNVLTYHDWPNLKLFTFGHIHEGYGEYQLGDIKLINGSHMDDEYQPNNPPVVIEL